MFLSQIPEYPTSGVCGELIPILNKYFSYPITEMITCRKCFVLFTASAIRRIADGCRYNIDAADKYNCGAANSLVFQKKSIPIEYVRNRYTYAIHT